MLFNKKEIKSKSGASPKAKSNEAFEASMECAKNTQNKAKGVCALISAILMSSQ